MISGPPTISLPAAIDDEYLSTDAGKPDGYQPANVPSKLAFFVLTVRLSDITSRMLQ